MGIQIHKRLIAAALALAATVTLSAQKTERTDSLVRLVKGTSLQLIEKDGVNYRKAIDATFLHNGTYLICDTALWNVDAKVINAVGHVQVLQDETKLTSEKMDYYIDDNLVKFRGSLVQLENRQKNILRTRHLDYNTKDSIAVFQNGGAMRDKDGQVIESIEGTYDSRAKVFDFNRDVNMFTDSVFVKTESLKYEGNPNLVHFNSYIDFWKEGNMLSANTGWYDRGAETFFFRGSVHGLTENQEVWCDTLYFYRGINDVLMLGDTHVQDTTRNVAAMADYMFYQDSLSRITMKERAAVALRTEQENKIDTIYFGADSLVYQTFMMFEIPADDIKAAEERLSDMFIDPVLEYRQKAAKEAAERAAQAAENDPNLKGKNQAAKNTSGAAAVAPKSKDSSKADSKKSGKSRSSRSGKSSSGEKSPVDAVTGADTPPMTPADSSLAPAADSLDVPAPEDSLELGAVADILDVPAPEDSLVLGSAADSLDVAAPADSSVLPPLDSLGVPLDSLGMPLDSLGAASDSLAVEEPKDSTKVGFLVCVKNVKVFRTDMQALCDSMQYCELDSIARFYIDPIVWNEGNRQYTSDSLFVLPKEGGIDRASLQSNAFIITQEDSTYFDQIKGAEVMAYFDTTSALRRFDALGGANALFYLTENDEIATVNKVESKMLSATMKDSEVERVYYFEDPKNNAYPIVQLPPDEHMMKGFNWQPDLRPRDRWDITALEVRKSERSSYLRHPKATFKYTDTYFPGYMAGVYRELEVKDSLSRLPKPVAPPVVDSTALDPGALDSLAYATLPDSSAFAPVDSLGVPPDSLATMADPLAPVDSLKAPADSVSTPVDPLSVPTVDPKQLRREQREEARKLRIARRDARWAELDARDAAKAEAKKQKELKKKREETRKAVIRQQNQDAKDNAKLQKYIEQYERQKLKSARKRPQGVEEGGEIHPTPGRDPETA